MTSFKTEFHTWCPGKILTGPVVLRSENAAVSHFWWTELCYWSFLICFSLNCGCSFWVSFILYGNNWEKDANFEDCWCLFQNIAQTFGLGLNFQLWTCGRPLFWKVHLITVCFATLGGLLGAKLIWNSSIWHIEAGVNSWGSDRPPSLFPRKEEKQKFPNVAKMAV